MKAARLSIREQALATFRAGWNVAKHEPGSVLDGTVSCKECRGLVLESNLAGHGEWHRKQGQG